MCSLFEMQMSFEERGELKSVETATVVLKKWKCERGKRESNS